MRACPFASRFPLTPNGTASRGDDAALAGRRDVAVDDRAAPSPARPSSAAGETRSQEDLLRASTRSPPLPSTSTANRDVMLHLLEPAIAGRRLVGRGGKPEGYPGGRVTP